ncbi:hypothetical protein J1614_007048 [Plenodomus biglobosus]|nr:hypothetical protein J1614_007048 [Plenodomus biglobosus]
MHAEREGTADAASAHEKPSSPPFTTAVSILLASTYHAVLPQAHASAPSLHRLARPKYVRTLYSTYAPLATLLATIQIDPGLLGKHGPTTPKLLDARPFMWLVTSSFACQNKRFNCMTSHRSSSSEPQKLVMAKSTTSDMVRFALGF